MIRWRKVRSLVCATAVCAFSLAIAGCALNPGAVPAIVHANGAAPMAVATAQGPVVGVRARAGEAFLGIPYAAPPVGPLRFRAPRPVEAWAKPRPADKLGSDCFQNLSTKPADGRRGLFGVRGNEDCLTLNVYAPSTATPDSRLPVMVWLHGGGFVLGAGGQYDPSVMAQRQGLVVVTVNYRLGALGFLALPELKGEGDGAVALLDQQAALRWVRANIAGFGGDAKNVTLFGESAGAWAACTQLAAPGAVGLFDRTILESGPCASRDSVIALADAEAGGARMAAALGCADTADRLACLQVKSVREIAAEPSYRRGLTGPNAWSPAYGGEVLPLSPREAFAQGRAIRAPMIDGTNQDEGRLFAVLQRFAGKAKTAKSYETLIRRAFDADADRVLARYPVADYGRPELAYAQVITDSTFACAARTLNRLYAPLAPVYAYRFADDAPPSVLIRFPGFPELGAYHASEIAYVFDTAWTLANPRKFSPAQAALSAQMQNTWAAFARTGAPNADWPSYEPASPVMRRFKSQAPPVAAEDGEERQCDFWAGLGY